MYPGEPLEIQPGISAVVFAPAGQTDLDAAVLDLAAVLDGLVFDNFETSSLLVSSGCNPPSCCNVIPATPASNISRLYAAVIRFAYFCAMVSPCSVNRISPRTVR